MAGSRKARIALFFEEVYRVTDQVSLSPSSVRTENRPIGVSVGPVGAGPAGLALAAELRRRGVETVTVDKIAEGANTSRSRRARAHAGGA